MSKERVVEWTLDDILGDVERISLVTSPATESDFMLFSVNDLKFKTTDTDKRIVTGVAMRPNFKILRQDEDGELYYGYFSEETVEQAQLIYFKRGQNTNNTNLEHEYMIDDVYVFESWIVEDAAMDKAVALGLTDVKKGDWMVSMKIENESVWNDFIKTGTIKGFSVEIKAKETDVNLSAVEEDEDEDEEIENQIEFMNELLNGGDYNEEEVYELIYNRLF